MESSRRRLSASWSFLLPLWVREVFYDFHFPMDKILHFPEYYYFCYLGYFGGGSAAAFPALRLLRRKSSTRSWILTKISLEYRKSHCRSQILARSHHCPLRIYLKHSFSDWGHNFIEIFLNDKAWEATWIRSPFCLDASLYRMTMDGLFHSSRQWNVRDKRRAGRQKQLVVDGRCFRWPVSKDPIVKWYFNWNLMIFVLSLSLFSFQASSPEVGNYFPSTEMCCSTSKSWSIQLGGDTEKRPLSSSPTDSTYWFLSYFRVSGDT